MSETLCTMTSLFGALSYSWQSFKLLKKREELKSELATLADGEDEDERVLDVRLEAHLAKKEMKEILKFWTVYALVVLYETYFELFVFWIPLYYTFKFALLLWIVAPHSRGSMVLFESLVETRMVSLDKWVKESATPALHTATNGAQSAIVGVFVGLATSFAPDEELDNVENNLEEMIERVRQERTRRLHKQKDDKTISDAEEKLDLQVSERMEEVDGKQSSGGASLWTMFSSIATTFYNRGDKMDGVEGNESKEGEEEASDGSEGSGWVMNAFDGVIGLTVTTKDVLLGRRPSVTTQSSLSTKQRLVPQEETVNESPHQNDAMEDQDDAFDKYQLGFDTLSEYDDSEGSSPVTSSHKSLREDKTQTNEAKTSSMRRRRPRNDLPPEPQRSTRSRTRNQAAATKDQ